MTLEVPLPAALRAATGVLWAGFGVWLLARRSRSPRATPVAWLLVSLGLGAAFANLAAVEARLFALSVWIGLALDAVALAGLWGLCRAEDRSSWGLLRRTMAFAGLAGVAGATLMLATGRSGLEFPQATGSLAVAYWAEVFLFTFLCCLLGGYSLFAALRSRIVSEAEARALAAIGGAFSIYALAYFFAAVPVEAQLAVVVCAIPFFAALVAWARARSGPAGGAATTVFVALFAIGLVVILFERPGRDVGTVGIARVASLGLLAYGAFRWGALDGGARRVRDHQAALLTAFLVLLLIVAQIAQNFFSSQYSLVLGGIVSGALVLAARPIERALDARRPVRSVEVRDAAKERSFLAAARRFDSDAHASREDERELMVLAEHLGIPASRAYELRDQVERERL